MQSHAEETNPNRITDPCLIDNITNLITEYEKPITTENDDQLVTEDSKIEVRFGDLPAMDILKDALKEFN